jgi:hypothetical protein
VTLVVLAKPGVLKRGRADSLRCFRKEARDPIVMSRKTRSEVSVRVVHPSVGAANCSFRGQQALLEWPQGGRALKSRTEFADVTGEPPT